MGNAYAYCGNNPWSLVDPYGLASKDPLYDILDLDHQDANYNGLSGAAAALAGAEPTRLTCLASRVVEADVFLEALLTDEQMWLELGSLLPVGGMAFDAELARRDFEEGRYLTGMIAIAAMYPALGDWTAGPASSLMRHYGDEALGGASAIWRGGDDFAGALLHSSDTVPTRGPRRVTVLGENMTGRVIPYAEATGAHPLPWAATESAWEAMTPRQRWRANDGQLRRRISAGDAFEYIGRDPHPSPGRLAGRQSFDLTGSELLRLRERGIPWTTVPQEVVDVVLGGGG